MKRYQFIKSLMYLVFLGGSVSCNGRFENIAIIKNYLKINLPSGVSSFNSANKCLDDSFKKPCIFFCSFLISRANFNNWIKEAKVPVVDSSFLKNTCNNDQQVLNKITNINLHDFARTNSYTWWKPSECNYQTLYASFYNSQSKNLIRDFDEYWDGRVLIVYCEDKSRCYFLAETFL